MLWYHFTVIISHLFTSYSKEIYYSANVLVLVFLLLFDTSISADVLVPIAFAKQNLLLQSSFGFVVPFHSPFFTCLLQVSLICFVYWLINFDWCSELHISFLKIFALFSMLGTHYIMFSLFYWMIPFGKFIQCIMSTQLYVQSISLWVVCFLEHVT